VRSTDVIVGDVDTDEIPDNSGRSATVKRPAEVEGPGPGDEGRDMPGFDKSLGAQQERVCLGAAVADDRWHSFVLGPAVAVAA
jgi:hypothetical protein